jgi:Domain of unknown function (DUF4333)
VSCPGDLKGEVNASMQCTLTNQDGSTVAVMVTATSVSGDQITYRYHTARTATPAPSPS